MGHQPMFRAEETDEALAANPRLQPETAKLHLEAAGSEEAARALAQLEEMPGILNVVLFQHLGLDENYWKRALNVLKEFWDHKEKP